MNLEFGNLLREFRKRAGLKQVTLAKMVSCADTEISRFETGIKLPSQALLHKIINVYRVSIPEDELIKLWDIAGYIGTPTSWQESPPAHPKILVINQLIADQIKRGWSQDVINSAMDYALSVVQAEIGINNSEELLKQREWKRGLESLNATENNLDRLENLYARMHSAQARADYGDGNYFNAINHYNQTLRSMYRFASIITDSFQKAHIQYQIGEALLNVGSVYRRKSQMSMAEDYYKQAEEIFANLNNKTAKEMLVNSLRKRAGILNYLGQANKAIELLEKCNRVSAELGDSSPTAIYKNWQHLGWSYRLLGKWDDAIDLNTKALELIHQQEPVDKWEVMKAHIYLGESYRLIRNGNLAKEHYEKAQQILHSIQDEGRHAKLQEGMILLGLGRVHLKRPTQLHLAEKFLVDSLQMHYQLGEELMVAAVQNELGELHIANDEFEQALNFLLQAKDYFKRIDADFYYLSCQASLCKCYFKGRDYFKGRKTYPRIYEIVEEVKDINDAQMQTHLAKIKLMAGRAILEEGNLENASIMFCESLKHAINFNKYISREVWGELSEDITILARDNKLDVALATIHSIKHYIEQTAWVNEQNSIVKELLTGVRAKEKEIKVLLSHSQKQKTNYSGG